jgi:hypothetical protein
MGSDADVREFISWNIDANRFDQHNQSDVVEVRATFTGTREVLGGPVFVLTVVWVYSSTFESIANLLRRCRQSSYR